MWFIKQKTWTFTYSHDGGKEKTTKTLNKMCETMVLDIQQQAEQDSDSYKKVHKEVNPRTSQHTEFQGYIRGRRNQTDPSHLSAQCVEL